MGIWKNFEDLEESLTIAEMYILLKQMTRDENERRKFDAALQGIELNIDEVDEEGGKSFEDVKRAAQAKLTGQSEEAIELQAIGIAIQEA